MLGIHETWKDDSFAEKKAAVMARYNIGSRQFSEAVKKIKASRDLARLVGLETNLTYLSDEKALFVVEQWAKGHPVRDDGSDKDYIFSDRNSLDFSEFWQRTREMNQSVLKGLTLEEFSDLETLFYIGRDHQFGEFYDAVLQHTLAEYRVASRLQSGVHHIMTKMNLLDCMVRGCALVGRPSLGAVLQQVRPVMADG